MLIWAMLLWVQEDQTCPVMKGEKVDTRIYVEHDGRRIYFCCEKCKTRFVADPDRYLQPRRESALGRFHPMLVHFPIALLLTAGLFEILRRRQAAALCLVVGTAGALAAALTGWLNARAPDPIHQWSGLTVVGLSLVTLLVYRWTWVYRTGLALCAAAVAVTGHYGGLMVHGDNFFSPPDRSVDFVRDIQPIFKSACLDCHGPEKAKGQLRLDSKASTLKRIVPGKSSESALMHRVLGQGKVDRMPLGGDPLTKEQIAVLRAWIDRGAPWPDSADVKVAKHWAYVKPVRPPGNSIDDFVRERSPEAPRETLLRRVFLDLTGLPPTIEDLDSTETYEQIVDRLLASPQYGERWARPWLDLARYADSQGYEKDLRRTAWKYRDWVIDALNRDLPFDQFTIEQIAGDLLPNATLGQRTAAGFHRNTMRNDEAGVDPGESRFDALVDRVNTTAAVWLGSTLGCAQCHAHKFDPFTQRDYYRLMAFFENADEQELRVPMPASAEADAIRRRIGEVEEQIALGEKNPELLTEQTAWEAEATAAKDSVVVLKPLEAYSNNYTTLTKQDDHSVLASGALQADDFYNVTVEMPALDVTGFLLEVLPDPRLPQGGPGRDPDGNFVLNGIVAEAGNRVLKFKTALATHENNSARTLIAGSFGGKWASAIYDESDRVARQVVLVLAKPERFEPGTKLMFRMFFITPNSRHQSIGKFRLSAVTASNPRIVVGITPDIRTILSSEQRDAEKLAKQYRSLAPSLRPLRDQRDDLRRKLRALETVTIGTFKERYEIPSAHIRIRGGYTSPGEKVFAGTPEALHPMRPDLPVNRLGLARWLVDPDNPLTARVVVNRFWEQFFGRGLVETSEDFGTQGTRPSHPELLDWLATEFIRLGWSMKAIHRTIVTSATYRQSSTVTAMQLEKDPNNRLLARGPRFRMEAEMIRDSMLAIGGLLSRKIGGPSVFPYQPASVYASLSFPDQWSTSTGDDRYRRGLYTYWKRTAPYPSFMTFDAPSRESCAVRRPRTNTPLQALTTLNDPAFFVAARGLASRLMAIAPAERAEHALRLCVSRRAKPAELDLIRKLYESELSRLKSDPQAAQALVGSFPAQGDVAEQAAWTTVANILLNLDETLTKE